MKVVARTDEYTIYQKRSERYAVKGSDTPFDRRIQSVRGHGGQIAVAALSGLACDWFAGSPDRLMP